jgi:hypothetical protein
MWLVSSLSGVRAVVVPLTWCGPCGQDMPADHVCHELEERLRTALHAFADQIHPTEGATPGATGAAVIQHVKGPRAMSEPTETFRRAREVKAGEVIVRHPHKPEQTGEWTATADAHPYGFNASIFCRDDQGREGVFNLGPCDFVIVRGADLLTDEERQQAFADLSADDRGHIAAHLLARFPRVLDDCLRDLNRYSHGLPKETA